MSQPITVIEIGIPVIDALNNYTNPIQDFIPLAANYAVDGYVNFNSQLSPVAANGTEAVQLYLLCMYVNSSNVSAVTTIYTDYINSLAPNTVGRFITYSGAYGA